MVQIRKEEKKLAARRSVRLAKLQARALLPRTLSKHKFEYVGGGPAPLARWCAPPMLLRRRVCRASKLDLKLTEELSGSLRQLQVQ